MTQGTERHLWHRTKKVVLVSPAGTAVENKAKGDIDAGRREHAENLSSDMRLVREILQRLEDGGRQSGPLQS